GGRVGGRRLGRGCRIWRGGRRASGLLRGREPGDKPRGGCGRGRGRIGCRRLRGGRRRRRGGGDVVGGRRRDRGGRSGDTGDRIGAAVAGPLDDQASTA